MPRAAAPPTSSDAGPPPSPPPRLDSGQTQAVEAHAVPAFARRPVTAVAAAVGTAHLVAAALSDRWVDESLMLAIGRHHLDWGAVDQPPMTPLLAAAADWLVPDSRVVLALPAILATVVGVLLAAAVARELGGDNRAQTLTALAQATALSAASTGHWLTPVSLEPTFWLAVGWLLVRWVRTRDDRLLLALGPVVGLGAQTKFQVMAFTVVVLVSVLLSGPREMLRRPLLWVGAGVAALIAAPTLAWQAAHGWPQLDFAAAVAAQSFMFGGRPGVAIGLLALAGPLGLGLVLVGLVALLRCAELREHRFLGVAFVVLYVLYVVPPGRPGYLAGAYGVLAAAGALWWQRRREAGRTRGRWVAWPATVLSAALACGALYVTVPVTSPAAADDIVAATARAYQALPPPQRARTALITDTYMYAAYLDSASPALGLPPVTSGSVSYGYFPPPPESQDAALYVGTDDRLGKTVLDKLRPSFTEVRSVARLTPAFASPAVYGSGRATTVWLLTGRHTPWTGILPATRSLGDASG